MPNRRRALSAAAGVREARSISVQPEQELAIQLHGEYCDVRRGADESAGRSLRADARRHCAYIDPKLKRFSAAPPRQGRRTKLLLPRWRTEARRSKTKPSGKPSATAGWRARTAFSRRSTTLAEGRPQRGQARSRASASMSSSPRSKQAVESRATTLQRGVPPRRGSPPSVLDITLPGIRRPLGAKHPVIRTMNEIVAVFRDLGYRSRKAPRSRPTTTISSR